MDGVKGEVEKSVDELERLLDEMFLDDTVDFLEEVPANVVTRVLAHSDPETRKLINRFLFALSVVSDNVVDDG